MRIIITPEQLRLIAEADKVGKEYVKLGKEVRKTQLYRDTEKLARMRPGETIIIPVDDEE